MNYIIELRRLQVLKRKKEMTIPILSLLVGLIIIGLVFWAARALCVAFGIGEPITTVIYVLLVIVVVLWLVNLIGVGPSIQIR